MKFAKFTIVFISSAILATGIPAQPIKNGSKISRNSISQLQLEIEQQQTKLAAMERKVSADSIKSREEITSLKEQIKSLEQRSLSSDQQIAARLESNEGSSRQTFEDLKKSVDRNLIYWLLTGLGLLGLSVILFAVLKRKMVNGDLQTRESLVDTRKQLETGALQVDTKLLQLIESQINRSFNENIQPTDSEVDHSFALKIADEVIRIQQNLRHMDPDTRGHKQLGAAIKRIHNSFLGNEYEIVDLLGQPYREGMQATVDLRPDQNLTTGMEIITKIVKPQVNFRGVMIQSAHLEVSVGQ